MSALSLAGWLVGAFSEADASSSGQGAVGAAAGNEASSERVPGRVVARQKATTNVVGSHLKSSLGPLGTHQDPEAGRGAAALADKVQRRTWDEWSGSTDTVGSGLQTGALQTQPMMYRAPKCSSRESNGKSSQPLDPPMLPESSGTVASMAKSVCVLAENVKAWQEELTTVSQKMDAIYKLQQNMFSTMGHHTEELLRRELRFHLGEFRYNMLEGSRRGVDGQGAAPGKVMCHEGTQTENIMLASRASGIFRDMKPVDSVEDFSPKDVFETRASDNDIAGTAGLVAPSIEGDLAPESWSRSSQMATQVEEETTLSKFHVSKHLSEVSMNTEGWRRMLREVEEKQLRSRLEEPGKLYLLLVMLGVPRESLPRQSGLQTPMEMCVRSGWFISISTLAILANAVFVGIEANSEMRSALGGGEPSDIFVTMNRIFIAFFFTELIVRMSALRVWFLLGKEGTWNLIDMIIVGGSIYWETQASGGAGSSSARIIRILRLLRVGRLIRHSPLLDELRTMAAAIVSSVTPLAWGAVVLLLIIYTFAVFFLQVAAQFVETHNQSFDDQATVALLRAWYPSLGDTMFTLFYAISGGSQWSVLVRPFADISEAYRIIYAIYIILAGLGVLKLFTAVFVVSIQRLEERDNAAVINRQIARENAFIQGLRRLILEAGKPGSPKATVTGWWLQGFLREQEVQAFFAANLLDWREVSRFYQESFRSKDMILVDDIVMDCTRLRGEARNFDIFCLQRDVGKLDSRMRDFIALLQTASADAPEAGWAAPAGGREEGAGGAAAGAGAPGGGEDSSNHHHEHHQKDQHHHSHHSKDQRRHSKHHEHASGKVKDEAPDSAKSPPPSAPRSRSKARAAERAPESGLVPSERGEEHSFAPVLPVSGRSSQARTAAGGGAAHHRHSPETRSPEHHRRPREALRTPASSPSSRGSSIPPQPSEEGDRAARRPLPFTVAGRAPSGVSPHRLEEEDVYHLQV